MNIFEKLSNIQNELKAPKGQFNKFGGYKYRSCEDILEAVKPICKKYKAVLVISDELENIGERYYIKATATLLDIESKEGQLNILKNTAYAREEESKKGMDGSQITGTASSYARKYALNGLFNIDDTKDADTDEFTKQTQVEDEGNKLITKVQVDALYDLIKKRAVENDEVMATLKNLGYDRLSEIKTKDYMNIAKHFENFRRD